MNVNPDASFVPLDKFIDPIALSVGECPYEVIEFFLRQKCIEFCTRSQVVIRQVTVPMYRGADEYVLDLDPREVAVSFQGFGDYGDWGKCSCTGSSGPVRLVPPYTLALSSPTTAHGTSVVRVATAPAEEACEVASVLYAKYLQYIVAGTRAELHAQSDVPWSQPAFVQVMQGTFEKGVARAGADRLTQGRRGLVNIRVPMV